MKIEDRIVSAAELADWLGLSVKTVITHTRAGVVVRKGRGQYLLGPSIKGYVAHMTSIADSRAAPDAATARLLKARADLAETKAADACRDMLDVREVAAEWEAIKRMVRAGLLAAPARITARLPHLSARDVAEIDREIREVLKRLDDDVHS